MIFIFFDKGSFFISDLSMTILCSAVRPLDGNDGMFIVEDQKSGQAKLTMIILHIRKTILFLMHFAGMVDPSSIFYFPLSAGM